jgi:ABC-type polysaccharide/polyol phosphate transport system ATPase subunit
MNDLSHEVLRLDGVWISLRRYRRPSDSLKETIIRVLKGQRSTSQMFWALRNVSLSVGEGESIGFCGPNGAGKSTLLKVIARILPPTNGRITIRRKLATMLELGAGFLPDLSGRENITLNGTILGLDEAQIRSKMGAILEFADIGEFIDSPVKTYSSGMYARLGFAIASHVEAAVLVFDEVLAVGDAAFQQKCLDRIQELRRDGTTMLIVSHDMPTLVNMCDRVVWLHEGRVMACGAPREVVAEYERGDLSRRPAARTDSP